MRWHGSGECDGNVQILEYGFNIVAPNQRGSNDDMATMREMQQEVANTMDCIVAMASSEDAGIVCSVWITCA